MQIITILRSRYFIFILFFVSVEFQIFGVTKDGEKYYKEEVSLHFGRDSYISGEKILYKAYCRNSSDPLKEALSKVIYVELVNEKNNHILGQILKTNFGAAESCLDIPDTLAAGVYYLKAYTQWMENFGPETFFSQPVYIYNLYNNDNNLSRSGFKVPEQSNIFIEGNKLIDGIQTKIVVYFPAFKSKASSFKVIEKESGQVKAEFSLDMHGNGTFELQPALNQKYQVILADSNNPSFNFQLPDVVTDGFKINMVSINEGTINVSIVKSNTTERKLKLELLDGERVLDSKSLFSDQLSNVNLSFKEKKGPTVRVLLRNDKNEVLASDLFLIQSGYSLQLKSLKEEYKPGEKVDLDFIFNSPEKPEQLNASVSIFKQKPALKEHRLGSVMINGCEYYPISVSENVSILLPLYDKHETKGNQYLGGTVAESLLPVENLGIIYTGTVIDKNTQTPVSNINVLFSVKDSTPFIQSVITDDDGKFALLNNLSGTPQNYISLYKDQQPVTSLYNIIFDKKFYYQENGFMVTDRFVNADSAFVNDIQDEAQRVLIQRVFAKKDEASDLTLEPTDPKSVYFSNSVLTVLTDDFFTMPNFEEIAREILPRVQYKKSKDGCNFSVATSAPESRSFNPLVLLNGVPVENKCDLYDMNSEMIHKILIQHESRIVGNLYYDALISIITVPTVKSKYLKANTENQVNLLCFNICQEYNPLKFNKSSNLSSKQPDFRNLIYWNSLNLENAQTFPINFIASDEEGDYIVELSGFLNDGTPVSFQKTFTVQSK